MTRSRTHWLLRYQKRSWCCGFCGSTKNGTKVYDLLHIDAFFDWEDSHLHEFTTIKHEKINKRQKLKDLLRVGKKIIYTYDFGDCWEHLITVESRQSPDLNKKYPCCIDGQNHAPFEDIGGIFGYLDILDALQDPKHPRYDDYMQIIEDEIGEIEFDPTYFNSHDIKF